MNENELSCGIVTDSVRKKEVNCGGIGFSELVYLIMKNDEAYRYLIYFYLDEISDWRFEQEMRDSGIGEREYLSRYFAARIPGELCYEKIMEKIEELEADV